MTRGNDTRLHAAHVKEDEAENSTTYTDERQQGDPDCKKQEYRERPRLRHSSVSTF